MSESRELQLSICGDTELDGSMRNPNAMINP